MKRWPCWQFNRCTLPPTSTKAKHPSSQTEKMCLETKFKSYKALLVEGSLSSPLVVWPHMTFRVDGEMILLAVQSQHTTSYIDKGEASIIANREDVS
eukprot:scaffold6496_cov161-Skeletonema_marinoi.AAC.4